MIAIIVAATAATQISFPDIGTVNDVSVGDQMLSQGVAERIKGVEFSSPFKAVFGFTAGFYTESNEDEKYIYLIANEHDDRSGFGLVLPKSVFGIDVSMGGVKFKVRKDSQRVCYGGNCADAEFRITERTQVSSNSFQQTLIYNGGSGGKIKLSYREFKDDVARSPFSNEIEYDLSQSRTIAYKHARIEVIEADNTHIKYRVISNFN